MYCSRHAGLLALCFCCCLSCVNAIDRIFVVPTIPNHFLFIKQKRTNQFLVYNGVFAFLLRRMCCFTLQPALSFPRFMFSRCGELLITRHENARIIAIFVCSETLSIRHTTSLECSVALYVQVGLGNAIWTLSISSLHSCVMDFEWWTNETPKWTWYKERERMCVFYDFRCNLSCLRECSFEWKLGVWACASPSNTCEKRGNPKWHLRWKTAKNSGKFQVDLVVVDSHANSNGFQRTLHTWFKANWTWIWVRECKWIFLVECEFNASRHVIFAYYF